MDFKFSFKPKSFHLQWHITERCNLKCRHCYFEPNFLNNELTLGQLFWVFKQYIELVEEWNLPLNSTRVSITGGEPLLREDLFDLLQKFREYRDKTRYGILTNGTLIDEKAARKIRTLRVDYVQVSLEGTEKINDQIRGSLSFARAVNGIKLLLRNGIRVGISMTVTKVNLQEVPKMISFCEKIGVNSLGIRRFVPIGRGKAMEKFMLSPTETKQIYEYIYKEKLRLKETKSKLTIILGCEDGILAQNEHYIPACCTAGYLSLTVLPNGDVYPCRRLPIKVGNALKDGLKEIYYKSEKLNEIRNLNNINEECQSCPYFIECRGGAKCITFGYFGTPFAPDPQCWRLFSKLPTKTFKTKVKKEVRLNKQFIEV